METKSNKSVAKKPPKNRDERLKAALKANLQRRKAQARARKDTDQEKG